MVMIEHCFYKPFELKLYDSLREEDASQLYDVYLESGRKLKEKILPHIKAVESQITFHGPEHVKHVMKQADKIIGDDRRLSSYDLFILGLSIMYHDVGNLEDRNGHASKINYALSTCSPDLGRSGNILIQEIVKAHSGSSDTISKVSENPLFNGEVINARELAAILRFADELAEGEVRTDISYIDKVVNNEESLMHHMYSFNTQVNVMDGSNSISIQYTVELREVDKVCCVTCNSNLPDKVFHSVNLAKYLEFTAKRLNKMNSERKYTRKYSPLISRISRIAYVFNFHGIQNEKVSGELNDFVLPDDRGEEPNLKGYLLGDVLNQLGGNCA